MRAARTAAFLALAAAVALLSACARSGGPGGPAHVLRIAYAGDPGSLVPFLAIDQEIIAVDTLFCQTLIGLDAGNRDVPILVTRVPTRENGDVSRDGTRIVYHLRRGIRFADGAELTSADVAFTYRAVFDPRNRATSVEPYRQIASLTTPGRYTVVVRLKKPWNAAVHVLFAQADYVYGILPAHAFESTKVVGTHWEDAPFGTGPFRVTRWLRGDRILLEPNPYFSPKPKLAQIVLQIVPNLNTNFVALQAGSVDVATLTPENVERAAALPGVRVLRTAENATGLLYLQTQLSPTNDVRVRRAIALALDLPALANAWRNEYPLATSFLPPPIVRWHGAPVEPYSRDLAKAGRLLDEAGWTLRDGVRQKNGVALAGIMGVNSEDPIEVKTATLVQAQLAQIGMAVTIKANPTRLWFSPDGLLRNGKATMVSQSWVGGGDPEQTLNLRCVQAVPGDANHSFYCSPKFEALYDDQASTPDAARRNRDYDAMAALIHDDVPVIPLYYEYRFLGVNRRVTDLRINMLWIPVDPQNWDAR